MMVVSFLPFLLRYWSVHGMPPLEAPLVSASAGQAAFLLPPGWPSALLAFALLAGFTCTVGWLLWRRGVPNAWVLGPLLAAALLAAAQIPVGAVPEWMVRTGQLCIGLSLGTRFTPGFLHTAPRYMAAVIACTATALGLAAGFGLLLANVSGLHPATAMLATSPGGIAEMALTARALHVEVPVVTAFHVCRMVVLVLAVGPAYRRITLRYFDKAG
jgi:membrane AbrB-like protein